MLWIIETQNNLLMQKKLHEQHKILSLPPMLELWMSLHKIVAERDEFETHVVQKTYKEKVNKKNEVAGGWIVLQAWVQEAQMRGILLEVFKLLSIW